MDGQALFNFAVAMCGALGGWMLKLIWDAIGDLKNDLRSLNKEVHEDFARRDDFKEAIVEIKEMLGKIFDKLDAKADKS